MAGKYIKLTNEQKEEIRRLTQLANRRIKAAHKATEKDGGEIAPYKVTGGIQLREQWEAKNYALSRSVKFTSQKEYAERLKFLRSFDPKAGGETRPTMTEHTNVERQKTLQAVETSLGEVPEDMEKKIKKMSAVQLGRFWNTFSDKAAKLGTKYSSNAAMLQTMEELFPEDRAALAEQAMIDDYIRDMKGA